MSDTPPAPTNRILLSGPTMWAVTAIGITQIIAWGTSFYALGVLATPIADDLGWSKTLIFMGFTIALLVSSAISIPAGLAIDQSGARSVMALGFVGLAASLYAMSYVSEVWHYFVVWSVTGLAMRLTLYDAAFAAMVQVDPNNGRRAIAYLTLWGGLASTVGWPVGHWLSGLVGWRDTFVIYAVVNLVVCAPLAMLSLVQRYDKAEADPAKAASTPNPPAEPPATPLAKPLEGRARVIAMVLFSIVMSVNAFAFSVGAVHLVGIIEASGVGLATAVGLAALKGLAQVAGRVWELVFGRHVAPMMLGRIAIVLLPISFAVLLAFAGGYEAALVFVLVFGVSNGIITVVRGAVPLALFGAEGYGSVLGIIATPVLLFNALSPVIFAMIIDFIDYRIATWALLGTGLLGMVIMEILAQWYHREQAQNTVARG